MACQSEIVLRCVFVIFVGFVVNVFFPPYKSNGSLALFKVGYQIVNLEQIQLYINGLYAQNSQTIKANDPSQPDYSKIKFETNGFLVGPEVCYAFNEFLQFQGFFGYGIYVSQKEKDNYYTDGTSPSYNADDESMTFLNLKLNCLLTNNLVASIGYRVKTIKSKVIYPEYDEYTNYTDKQGTTTVGFAYYF